MINILLLTILITAVAVISISGSGGYAENKLIIGFASYEIEITLLSLFTIAIALLVVLRMISWIINIPRRVISRYYKDRTSHLLQSGMACWLKIIASELDAAQKSLINIRKDLHPGLAAIMEGIILEKSLSPLDAIERYRSVSISADATQYEKLVAVKLALSINGISTDEMHALISCAESLSSETWVMRARFKFYLHTRQWHMALNMIDYSLLNTICKNKKHFFNKTEEIEHRAALYCAIAADYAGVTHDDAKKYWAKAIKITNNHVIRCMYCDYLIAHKEFKAAVDYLYELLKVNPNSWLFASKCLTILQTDRQHHINLGNKLPTSFYAPLFTIAQSPSADRESIRGNIVAISQAECHDHIQTIVSKMARIILEIDSGNGSQHLGLYLINMVLTIPSSFICAACGGIASNASIECRACNKFNTMCVQGNISTIIAPCI